MWNISLMKDCGKYLLIFLIAIFCSPLSSFAAEILQVTASNQLQIGDRNRSYTVELACVEVPPESQFAAIQWLKSNLQRKKRVNLRPVGSKDGILLARVVPVNSTLDIGASLVREGLATSSC